jgi:hypothetical protein
MGFIFLTFVALIISHVGATAISGVNLNPHLFFGHQTTESSNFETTQTGNIEYQNYLPLNGKKMISGIDHIVPRADQSVWCEKEIYVKEGYIDFNSILPEYLDIKVKDNKTGYVDGWQFVVDVVGGYEPTNMVPDRVVLVKHLFPRPHVDAWIDYDADGTPDIFVDYNHDGIPDWDTIYGFIDVTQKGDYQGKLVVTALESTVVSTTCCTTTYTFAVSVYGKPGAYFCLDSTEWPDGPKKDDVFPWETDPKADLTHIPGKDHFKFEPTLAWEGCPKYDQRFTHLSVREKYQFPNI